MGINSVIKLFACCVPVKGSARSVIYDLQRKRYFFIPNALCDLLLMEMGKSIEDIKKLYANDEHEILDRYLNFLFENEVIYECPDVHSELFPPIDFTWESAFALENFILDSDASSHHDYQAIINQLSELNLRVLQLRFFSKFSFDALRPLLNQVTESNIRTVEIIMPQYSNAPDVDIFVDEFVKISNLTIFGSKKNEIKKHKQANVIFTKEVFHSELDCGRVEEDLFTCNLDSFCEAKRFNTCLNRKLSVDKYGEIKNCPAMKKSYGSIGQNTLESVLKSDELKNIWNVSKDMVSVCRDCEYRYMCHDCRAFIKDPTDLLSQPAKCDYNPYIAKWKNENGYVPVENMLLED